MQKLQKGDQIKYINDISGLVNRIGYIYQIEHNIPYITLYQTKTESQISGSTRWEHIKLFKKEPVMLT
jgi:hypothetical protein